MKAVAVALLVVVAAVAQVTVSPRFPIQAAVADMVLVTLVLAAAFAGPRIAMLAVPFAAICLGFASSREPGLLLLAYLPILPLARWLEFAPVPLSGYWRLAWVTFATGAWARCLLAFGALTAGAGLELFPLITLILIPGALLDWALLTVVFLPHRFVGWEVRPMDVQRGGIL